MLYRPLCAAEDGRGIWRGQRVSARDDDPCAAMWQSPGMQPTAGPAVITVPLKRPRRGPMCRRAAELIGCQRGEMPAHPSRDRGPSRPAAAQDARATALDWRYFRGAKISTRDPDLKDTPPNRAAFHGRSPRSGSRADSTDGTRKGCCDGPGPSGDFLPEGAEVGVVTSPETIADAVRLSPGGARELASSAHRHRMR